MSHPHVKEKQQHSEPAKKKPHISRREYIRWPPQEPYENTNTLVVTSGGDRFVDIRDRIYTPDIAGVRHSDMLEWAFAGVASNNCVRNRDGTSMLHCSWRHLVDSRTDKPDLVNDAGQITPLAGGRSLEKGKMVNPLQPAAGEQQYEEGWIDVPIQSQRADGKLETVVLQLMENGCRGMVVRVGHVCQGIVRIGDDYCCERWMWTQEGGWKRIFKDGRIWMPTGLATEMWKLKLDDEVKNDYEQPWKVVEIGLSD